MLPPAPAPTSAARRSAPLHAGSAGPALTVAGVAVLWGTIGVLVREVPLPAIAIVASRVTIAAVALGTWLLVAERRRHRDRGPVEPGPGLVAFRPGRTLANGVLLAGHWVALFAALQRAPIGTVLLVTYLAPVLVAAAAPRALGEHVGPRVVVALVVALVGTALVVGPGTEGADGTGLVLAGLAAVSYAVLVLVAKPLAEHYGGVRLAFVEMAVAAAVLAPLALAADWGRPEASWAWLVVLGVVHTAAGVGLYLGALAHLPATSAGILAYLEPASAVLFGWLLLAETPGPATVVGGLLILVGGAVVVRTSTAAARVVA